MNRRRWAAAMVGALASLAVIATAPVRSSAAATAVAPCTDAQLRLAPVVQGDHRDDGSPVAMTPDRRGKQVPVVLVPDAGDVMTVDSAHRRGAFAHPVDLTTGATLPGNDPRSLLGELEDLPGTQVYSFDYTPWASHWVDDAHLGAALGHALDCLYRLSGEKAVLLTHGTGGLVARAALAGTGDAHLPRDREVSTVIAFGTPTAGSTLGLLTPGGIAAGRAAGLDSAGAIAATLRVIAAGCAAGGTAVADGSWCDGVTRSFAAAGGGLGSALVPGSTQLRSLPDWPPGVAVHDLRTDLSLTLPPFGWFAGAMPQVPVAVGDLFDLTDVLSPASQTAACTVALTEGTGGLSVAEGNGQATPVPLSSAVTPCLGSDSTRDAQQVARARDLVLADLFARQPLVASDLQRAPVPALCNYPAGELVNGVLPGFDPDRAEPPTLVSPDSSHPGPLVVLGDLDGDGVGDAAGVVNCNEGGVGWPDEVLFWGSGLRLLGAVDMGQLVGGARDGTEKLTYQSGHVVVDSLDSRPWDAGCCASGTAQVTITWNGSALETQVEHRAGPTDIVGSSLGPLRIGMTAHDLQALGLTGSPSADGCAQYVYQQSTYVTYDPTHDSVVRIYPFGDSGFEGHHTFPEGIGVGSTLGEVYAAYASHRIESHLDGSYGQGLSGLLVQVDGGWLGFGTTDGLTVSDVELSDHTHFGSLEAGC